MGFFFFFFFVCLSSSPTDSETSERVRRSEQGEQSPDLLGRQTIIPIILPTSSRSPRIETFLSKIFPLLSLKDWLASSDLLLWIWKERTSTMNGLFALGQSVPWLTNDHFEKNLFENSLMPHLTQQLLLPFLLHVQKPLLYMQPLLFLGPSHAARGRRGSDRH